MINPILNCLVVLFHLYKTKKIGWVLLKTVLFNFRVSYYYLYIWKKKGLLLHKITYVSVTHSPEIIESENLIVWF